MTPCPCHRVLFCAANELGGVYVRSEQNPHVVLPYRIGWKRSEIGYLPFECPRLVFVRYAAIGDIYRWT